MGFPAARLTDMHVCPLVTGLVPHVGGPVLPPCAPTVLIGGLPAARVTDPATCVGPPDTIVRGAASVLIGKLPAARMLDQTVHGGAIVVGCPTVLIGDPAVVFPFSLQGSPAQIAQVQEALGILYGTPSGKALIASLAASGRTVTIQVNSGGSFCNPTTPVGTPGDSTVLWDPSQGLPGLPAGDPRSGAVVLGHELCHADHNANGTQGGGPIESHPNQQGSSNRTEERQTVGSAPPYDAAGNPVVDAQGRPAGTHVRQPDGSFVRDTNHSAGGPGGSTTENAIRRDLGFPDRSTYYPPNWPGGPPW